MKVVIEWFKLWSNCTFTKMSKEHGRDVRLCEKNNFEHCDPEHCPLLKE